MAAPRSVFTDISDLGHFLRGKSDLVPGRSLFTDKSDLRSLFSKVANYDLGGDQGGEL